LAEVAGARGGRTQVEKEARATQAATEKVTSCLAAGYHDAVQQLHQNSQHNSEPQKKHAEDILATCIAGTFANVQDANVFGTLAKMAPKTKNVLVGNRAINTAALRKTGGARSSNNRLRGSVPTPGMSSENVALSLYPDD
jgi:hypothetical protein